MEGGIKYGSDSEKYRFNHQYGFGLVDAAAAVKLAERWDPDIPDITDEVFQASSISDFLISRFNTSDGKDVATMQITVDTDDINFIEFIEVTLKMWHPSFSDVAVNLISPSGFVSELAVTCQ